MEGINQNFEGVKNDVFVEREREREREIAFICSIPNQRHPTLTFFNSPINMENPL